MPATPGEFDLIARHFSRHVTVPGIDLGVGDDCALLTPTPGTQLAVSVDTLVEGVHFPVDTPPADVGHKALAVNLSDLAAMGATPRACFLALTLPSPDESWVAAFAQGFLALADVARCPLAGGDTTRGPRAVSVTVIGEVPAGEALRRDGAREGDLVCASGTLGDAALGLERWQAGNRELHDIAINRLLRPSPRLTLGRELLGVASAAIDVSDGLLADLGHVLDASSRAAGIMLGAEINLAALPLSPALAALTDEAAREHALAGGDDYELCFTIPPSQLGALRVAAASAGLPVAVIGRVTRLDARAGATRIRCLDSDGSEWQPQRRGYEHFAGNGP